MPPEITQSPLLHYYLHRVSRVFVQLGGESVRQFAEKQYDRGWHRRRKHPREVKIVGDRLRGRIVLVDVQEMNGQAKNGRLKG